MAISEAQKKAKQKYEEKNREKINYQASRRSARSFIKNKATLEDLEELEALILERRKNI